MEALAEELAGACLGVTIPQSPEEIVKLVTADGRLDRMLQLREAPKTRAYTNRRGSRTEIKVDMAAMLQQWLSGAELVEMANTHFSRVADIGYRFEQLGDFIVDYFETFLPWVFGVVVDWANTLLAEKGADAFLPRGITAAVHWGVSSFVAARLMAMGILSRSLASRVAAVWEAVRETPQGEAGIRSWVGTLGVAEWQRRFEASVTELRNLLEFSRRRGRGVAATLLAEETAQVEVESRISECPQIAAVLAPTDDSPVAPIGIWTEGTLVGQVMTRDHADIQDLVDSGLIISAEFSASSGKGLLQLRLEDTPS
jgi:hypothetical protein